MYQIQRNPNIVADVTKPINTAAVFSLTDTLVEYCMYIALIQAIPTPPSQFWKNPRTEMNSMMAQNDLPK